MPSESAAGGLHPALPARLRSDRAAFLDAIQREAARRSPGDPIRSALQDPKRIAAWDRYAGLVHSRSARQSLIAARDRDRIFTRHILDSLNPLEVLEPAPRSLLDIGSGAGFPGIPLAIACGGTRVTLLESRERKVGFLERALRDLSLGNAVAVGLRLEDYARKRARGLFEAVTIRAVGGLADLLGDASRVAEPGARWVYFVGSRERGDAVLASLQGTPFEGAARTGVFGGALLVGTFAPGP